MRASVPDLAVTLRKVTMALVLLPEALPDLCRPFLGSLPIAGAAITVIASSGAHLTLCASDDVAARIDEFQFELGERPQLISIRSGELVMIPEVSSAAHGQWPIFATALSELPVGAVFCVPIRMGAVTVGIATLYSRIPLELDLGQQATALAIASAIAGAVVQQAMASASADGGAESSGHPELRREVHQATGMMLVQLNVTATDAYARLQAYAFANGRSVQAVAHDVVTGSLSFDDTSL